MAFHSAIIVAGGKGSRIGGGVPKQFLELGARPVLDYSVQTFANQAGVREVVVVVPEDYVEQVQEQYPQHIVVPGGETRQLSVLAGVNACRIGADFCLIHDAARPLISETVIQRCLARLGKFEAVAPVITSEDSLLQLEDPGFEYLDRERIRRMQTPQCFKLERILKALEHGENETDEIRLYQRIYPGAAIALVEGEARNMKITRLADLALAATYLRGSH